MSKIICDVCGTEYPETAEQCPICGTARAAGQAFAADTAPSEAETSYTYVKGGRFSKSNVRKRLRASQEYVQEQPDQKKPVQKKQEIPNEIVDEDDDDYEDQETGSNRSLIVVVILLLLAIIAVSSYIAITYLGVLDNDDPGSNVVPTHAGSNGPTSADPTDPGSGIPCTDLTVSDRSVDLNAKGAQWLLNVSVKPADTTDAVVYISSDPTVVTVDKDGLLIAKGPGEAIITITCGEFEAECAVKCNFEPDPTDPTDPNGGEDPTEPTYDPNETYELRFNGQTNRYGNDTTINAGEFFNLTLVNSQGEVMEVVWTVADPRICSVNGKTITGLHNGDTTVSTTFAGATYTCIVRVKNGTPPPEEGTEVPGTTYMIRINDMAPTYGNGTTVADTTYTVGTGFKLTVENDMGARMPVEWTIEDPSICSYSAEDYKVTCLAVGTTNLIAEYEGVTYKVTVRVIEAAATE